MKNCYDCENESALARARLIPWIVVVLATAAIVMVSFSGLVGEASFYNTGYQTASGELFDKDAMTCARPGRVYLGKTYRVTNLANRKSVVVRCNDVGPAARTGRIIDLTEAAFKKIADPALGHVRVRVERFRRFNESF
ncbi:MAG: septal ring lytic transglycosylase RlpA family protein [Patescibacteria group bacterium]